LLLAASLLFNSTSLTVRPDGRYLLLIQGFCGAETPGSRGSYQAAKDSEVSAPTEPGVKGCIGPPGLLFISTSSTVSTDGQDLFLIPDFRGAETPGSRSLYQATKDPGVSAPTDAGVTSCVWPTGLLVNSASSSVCFLSKTCFPGAETTLRSRGLYQAAKDPRVSALTNAGVESCFRPPGLLVKSAS
jgi:hypothetical protein